MSYNQTVSVVCVGLSFACFVMAALPHKLNIRFEWLAMALLVMAVVFGR